MGVGKAITATAHKLARLIFAMLTKGDEYVERSQEQHENKMYKRTVAYLKRKAAALSSPCSPSMPFDVSLAITKHVVTL